MKIIAHDMDRGVKLANEEEIERVGSTCIICLEKLEVGDAQKLRSCIHAFCISCCQEWFKYSSQCPTCRTAVTKSEILRRSKSQSAHIQITWHDIEDEAPIDPVPRNQNRGGWGINLLTRLVSRFFIGCAKFVRH